MQKESLGDNASTTAPARAIIWVPFFRAVHTRSAGRVGLNTGAACLLLLQGK